MGKLFEKLYHYSNAVPLYVDALDAVVNEDLPFLYIEGQLNIGNTFEKLGILIF